MSSRAVRSSIPHCQSLRERSRSTKRGSKASWGGRRDLNPRLSEPQSDALPAELLPPQRNKFTLVCASGKAPRRSDTDSVKPEFQERFHALHVTHICF